jgi:DNA-directed RNA polymerase alpha subunit
MKTDAAKEVEMIALRDQGLTFAEIGKRAGTSRQTVQRIVSRAHRLQARKVDAGQCIANLPSAEIPLREFLVANDASTRLTNAMHCNGYDTVGDVLKETESRLLRLPHMGKVSAQELVAILERHGLALRIGGTPGAQADIPVGSIALRDFLFQNNASTRLVQPLINCNHYQTVNDLLQAAERQLLRLPHMGKKLVEELRTILHQHALQLRP